MFKKTGIRGKLTIHIILQILVIAVMVAEIFHRNFYNVFLCTLTLMLFNIPAFVNLKLNIKLPSVLETVILLFIFAAEILGEIQSFYTIFPYWDTMLHTINGFIMAAIGFAMIDILNQNPRFHFDMSPFFVTFVAFCFSMTIGVVWEFFEFSMDYFFGSDMQKDTIVNSINSVTLNPYGLNDVETIKGITGTVVNTAQGQQMIDGGYLDVGIIDTMKDLIVNCIGALCFSVIGIFYIKHRGRGKVAESFIPQMKTPEEIEQTQREIEKIRKRRRKNEKDKYDDGGNDDDISDNDGADSAGC